jgi:hypothetical protein
MKKILAVLLSLVLLTSCSENYSNGERIGVVTQFSKTGVVWKSNEGHLNVTQTGMNSSVPFDFSIDNDNESEELIKKIDSAAQFGWKVKLVYHETFGKNWFNNRGETDHFVTDCQVLEKNFGNAFNGKNGTVNLETSDRLNNIELTLKSLTDKSQKTVVSGRVIDTIYVVIDKSRK